MGRRCPLLNRQGALSGPRRAAADQRRRPNPGPRRPPGETRPSERLAALFAVEPELIPACSEPAGPWGLAGDARVVLSAALAAAAAHPDYADLQYHAARAALRGGKLAQAEELLERALAANPCYLDALILSAKLSRALGDADRAISCLNRALAAGADFPEVHLMLAELWRACGEPAGAGDAR